MWSSVPPQFQQGLLYEHQCLSTTTLLQIETIFDIGDIDGDGTIDMGEFVGESLLHLTPSPGLMFPEGKASQRSGRPKVTVN